MTIMENDNKLLLVFPYNGNGREALDCLDRHRFIGFIDDTRGKQGRDNMGNEVFSRDAISRFKDAEILAVPGSPDSFFLRKKIIEDLNVETHRFATIIHPSARISPSAKIGFNTLIMAGVVITSEVTIGNHVCILPNTVIQHDTVIRDWTLIGGGVVIAGNVVVGENCYIGSGSNIINSVEIGKGTLIGLGSNVLHSLSCEVKAVWNPARVIGRIERR